MRHAEQKTFETHDKVALFYRYWPAASGTPRGAILLFHRGHEHSGRMAHLTDELDLPDFAVFAWDARGHGLSPGERGFSPASAPRYATCRPSWTISPRNTALRSRTWRWWRKASAPSWPPPGCTTMRRKSAPWC